MEATNRRTQRMSATQCTARLVAEAPSATVTCASAGAASGDPGYIFAARLRGAGASQPDGLPARLAVLPTAPVRRGDAHNLQRHRAERHGPHRCRPPAIQAMRLLASQGALLRFPGVITAESVSPLTGRHWFPDLRVVSEMAITSSMSIMPTVLAAMSLQMSATILLLCMWQCIRCAVPVLSFQHWQCAPVPANAAAPTSDSRQTSKDAPPLRLGSGRPVQSEDLAIIYCARSWHMDCVSICKS